ncbi:DUF2750 domain-containing protein [uncultured Winogradskyella sp.]|uniref:DUF2750 domain-containing protein n=1 Tax=uncultured Winogradskyella sp. TaxID=395353 RepID=UPI002632AA12|nr:DUF2750 domain-containing protein [uncultured Winogradskyella sp.]
MKKVADFEELWTVVDNNGDIGLSDIDDKTLIPMWPKEAYIKSCLEGNWKNHIPFKITLDDFEETIIAFISENNYLINVFPVDEKTGFIVNLNEFIRDLNEELEWYE